MTCSPTLGSKHKRLTQPLPGLSGFTLFMEHSHRSGLDSADECADVTPGSVGCNHHALYKGVHQKQKSLVKSFVRPANLLFGQDDFIASLEVLREGCCCFHHSATEELMAILLCHSSPQKGNTPVNKRGQATMGFVPLQS